VGIFSSTVARSRARDGREPAPFRRQSSVHGGSAGRELRVDQGRRGRSGRGGSWGRRRRGTVRRQADGQPRDDRNVSLSQDHDDSDLPLSPDPLAFHQERTGYVFFPNQVGFRPDGPVLPLAGGPSCRRRLARGGEAACTRRAPGRDGKGASSTASCWTGSATGRPGIAGAAGSMPRPPSRPRTSSCRLGRAGRSRRRPTSRGAAGHVPFRREAGLVAPEADRRRASRGPLLRFPAVPAAVAAVPAVDILAVMVPFLLIVLRLLFLTPSGLAAVAAGDHVLRSALRRPSSPPWRLRRRRRRRPQLPLRGDCRVRCPWFDSEEKGGGGGGRAGSDEEASGRSLSSKGDAEMGSGCTSVEQRWQVARRRVGEFSVSTEYGTLSKIALQSACYDFRSVVTSRHPALARTREFPSPTANTTCERSP
jgi:hypothetical protein